MKVFVLYDRSGIHSGRELGIAMDRSFRGKATISRGRPDRLENLIRNGEKFDYIINVGWYRAFSTGGATVINVPEAISTSSNKMRARRIFDKEDVPAPKLWLDAGSIPEDEFPVVARTTNHSKGSGFWMCKDRNEASKSRFSGKEIGKKKILTKKGARVWRDREIEVSGSTHFMKFIPNTREFRVHLVAGDIDIEETTEDSYFAIKTSEKVPTAKTNHSNVIKNHENGWIFSYPSDRKDPILKAVRATAKKAMVTLGLHWGAVDIMVSKDTGESYVLEINSSPCLTDESSNTLDKYLSALGSLIGLNPKMERKDKEDEVMKVKRTKSKASIKSLLNKHTV